MGGRFSPPQTRSLKERLKFYQEYFSLVELFTQEPSIPYFEEYEKVSRPSTKFVVRIPWSPRLEVDSVLGLITAVSPIVESGKFFGFLVQLEQQVHRNQQRIEHLLSISSQVIKRRLDIHIEFRHLSWHNHYVLQILKDHGIGICNCEIPSATFPLKAYATTEKGYIRYTGPSRWRKSEKQDGYLYTEAEIEERIQGQITLSTKVSQIAVVYGNVHLSFATVNAIQNIRQLKQKFEIAEILRDVNER